MARTFGKFTLYPFQEESLDITLNQKRTLLALEQGLGKTIVVGGFIVETKPSFTVVVCPASLRLNWQCELIDCGIDENQIKVASQLSDTAQGCSVLIVSYEFLSNFQSIKNLKPELIVFDESHFLKSSDPRKVSGKWVNGSLRSRAANWFCNVANPEARVILATGTPYVGCVTDLVIPSQIINQKDIYFPGFAQKYAGRVKSGYKGKKTYSGINKDRIGELREKHLSNMVRLRKRDCLDLPKKIRAPIKMPAPDFSEDYHRLASKYKGVKGERLIESMMSGAAVPDSAMSSLRLELGLKTIEPGTKLLRELLEDGEPLVAFAWHKEVIAKVLEGLKGVKTSLVVGDTPPAERHQAVKDFQEGKTQLFLGNITAAGVGLTLTAASRVLFLEMPWTAAELEQCEDRINRIGATGDSHLINYFIFKNTLQEAIYRVALRKMGEASELIDSKGTQ